MADIEPPNAVLDEDLIEPPQGRKCVVDGTWWSAEDVLKCPTCGGTATAPRTWRDIALDVMARHLERVGVKGPRRAARVALVALELNQFAVIPVSRRDGPQTNVGDHFDLIETSPHTAPPPAASGASR